MKNNTTYQEILSRHIEMTDSMFDALIIKNACFLQSSNVGETYQPKQAIIADVFYIKESRYRDADEWLNDIMYFVRTNYSDKVYAAISLEDLGNIIKALVAFHDEQWHIEIEKRTPK